MYKIQSHNRNEMLVAVSWGVFIVLLANVTFGDVSVDDLCTRCSGSASNESLVGQNCSKTNHSYVAYRCCVQNTTTRSIVIGLDWSRCNITKLEAYQFASVGGSLLWIDLSYNDIQFTASLRDRWFGGLTKLDLLLLPKGANCNDKAWSVNQTYDTMQLCSSPLYCNVSDDDLTNKTSNNSVLCPPDSHCIPDGPGLHQCICNSDHYGYKCIQQTGSFPYAVFFSASAATTLSLIIIDRIIRRIMYLRRARRQDSVVQ